MSDRLDSVHVAGQTLFLIQGDKPQSLNWEEYGFRLHFPQGTISPSDTCEVVVKALVGGKFEFPEGTELVSAVYVVAFAKKLLKPVEMEIQHCVNLTNEEQGKHLSFVSTAKDNQNHPNKFELIEGGEFNPGTRYGSIKRIHYCKKAIVSSQNDDKGTNDIFGVSTITTLIFSSLLDYTGQIYYERIGFNRWCMRFMVTKDINVFKKV